MKIGAFGEVMLRLTPPEYYLLEQTTTLNMAYTGTGVNILSNLAHFDLESYLLTNLPANHLGDAAKANLRKLGINTMFVGQKYQHLGSYFAELGYGSRPTHVTYQNRHHSAFGVAKITDYALDEFIDTVDLVHVCGISLGLTEETWQMAKRVVQKAQEKDKKVCFDFNFRPSLNTEAGKKEKMKQRYEEILPYCHLVFGSPRDVTELLQRPMASNTSEPNTVIQQFMKDYQIEWFAGTTRDQNVATGSQQLTGYLYTQTQAYMSSVKELQILDRIGAGDAYAAGLLLGYAEGWPLQKSVDFAATNAVLAHTIFGDVPLTTRSQVEQVMVDPTINLIR